MEFAGGGFNVVWLCLVFTGNDALPGALAVRCSRSLPEWFLEQNLVQIPYVALAKNLLFSCESSSVVYGDIVRFHFLVVSQRMPTRRAVEQEQQFGFVIGEGVSLDVVTVVVPFEPELFPQTFVVFAFHLLALFAPFTIIRRVQIGKVFEEMNVLDGEARDVDT